MRIGLVVVVVVEDVVVEDVVVVDVVEVVVVDCVVLVVVVECMCYVGWLVEDVVELVAVVVVAHEHYSTLLIRSYTTEMIQIINMFILKIKSMVYPR